MLVHAPTILDPSRGFGNRLLYRATFAKKRELWCREGDLNPHNPFGAADFKSAASASFAIPAWKMTRKGPLQSRTPFRACQREGRAVGYFLVRKAPCRIQSLLHAPSS